MEPLIFGVEPVPPRALFSISELLRVAAFEFERRDEFFWGRRGVPGSTRARGEPRDASARNVGGYVDRETQILRARRRDVEF